MLSQPIYQHCLTQLEKLSKIDAQHFKKESEIIGDKVELKDKKNHWPIMLEDWNRITSANHI